MMERLQVVEALTNLRQRAVGEKLWIDRAAQAGFAEESACRLRRQRMQQAPGLSATASEPAHVLFVERDGTERRAGNGLVEMDAGVERPVASEAKPVAKHGMQRHAAERLQGLRHLRRHRDLQHPAVLLVVLAGATH